MREQHFRQATGAYRRRSPIETPCAPFGDAEKVFKPNFKTEAACRSKHGAPGHIVCRREYSSVGMICVFPPESELPFIASSENSADRKIRWKFRERPQWHLGMRFDQGQSMGKPMNRQASRLQNSRLFGENGPVVKYMLQRLIGKKKSDGRIRKRQLVRDGIDDV